MVIALHRQQNIKIWGHIRSKTTTQLLVQFLRFNLEHFNFPFQYIFQIFQPCAGALCNSKRLLPPPPLSVPLHCFRMGSSLGLKKAWAIPMAKMYTLESTTIFSFFSSSAGERTNRELGRCSWGRSRCSRPDIALRKTLSLTVYFRLEFIEGQKDDFDEFWEERIKVLCEELIYERKGIIFFYIESNRTHLHHLQKNKGEQD